MKDREGGIIIGPRIGVGEELVERVGIEEVVGQVDMAERGEQERGSRARTTVVEGKIETRKEEKGEEEVDSRTGKAKWAREEFCAELIKRHLANMLEMQDLTINPST